VFRVVIHLMPALVSARKTAQCFRGKHDTVLSAVLCFQICKKMKFLVCHKIVGEWYYNLPYINPLNAKLNPTCHLLALLGAHHILHVSRIRVNP